VMTAIAMTILLIRLIHGLIFLRLLVIRQQTGKAALDPFPG